MLLLAVLVCKDFRSWDGRGLPAVPAVWASPCSGFSGCGQALGRQ